MSHETSPPEEGEVIRAELHAYLTQYRDPREFDAKVADPERHLYAIDMLTFATPGEVPKGWAFVGLAEITLHLPPRVERVKAAVAALNAALAEERVETAQRQNALIDKINNLLALEAPGDDLPF